MTDDLHQLETDSAVYKTLLESTRAIPWKIDWKTLTFAYIGPQIEQLLGWEPSSWKTVEDWASRMHPEDREWVVNFCVEQSKAGCDHEADYRALTRDGRYVWIRDVVHVLRNAEGEAEALIGFMFDISERKKTEHELLRLKKELEELSFKDGLTGIANRRMFDLVLEKEWMHARRNRQPLSLIMIDIDHFKQYNDHYGHLQGDDCLREVGQLLGRAATRGQDLVARFGGEEFVLVLPQTDAHAVQVVAERCQALVSAACIPHVNGIGGTVTFSMGVATLVPRPDQTPQALLAEADRLLYEVKAAGRNGVRYGQL